ncbi:MAG: hypothetical protein ABJD68_12690, partial [Nakamurella sp.]
MATALADAMLAGPWDFDSALSRLHRTLGRHPRWLGQLTREVMQAYPHPPADRPRELAAFVLAGRVLRQVR